MPFRPITAQPVENSKLWLSQDRSGSTLRYQSVFLLQEMWVGERSDPQVPLPMFNWSGNKGSFMGDIPFYGKTGLDFYTQRKVSQRCVPQDNQC